jgi:hypothetical protein
MGSLRKSSTTMKHYPFVIVDFGAANSEAMSAFIGKVVEAFDRHHGIVPVITSFLVIGYLGIPFREYDLVERRLSLVSGLLAENGNLVRIAHGQCDGIVGLLGRRHNIRIPGLPEIREKFSNIPFATALEVH